jgi:hypothetical protein
MAIDVQPNQTHALLKQYLDDRLRYRCLVIQGNDISILSQVSHQVHSAFDVLKGQVQEIDAIDQFDAVGALSCNYLIDKIKALAFSSPVLITGPLHFLDYWSPSVRMIYWNFLSAFSNGPGIVVTDVFRTETVLGPFQSVDGFGRTDLRCLKSRLEFTQDRLA